MPSAGDASATAHSVFPVAGSMTSNVRPSDASVPLSVDEQPLLDSLDDLCLVLFAHNYPFIVGGFVRYADC